MVVWWRGLGEAGPWRALAPPQSVCQSCLLLGSRTTTGTVERKQEALALDRKDARVASLAEERQRGTYRQNGAGWVWISRIWDLGLIRHGILSGREGGVTPWPPVGASCLLPCAAARSLACLCAAGVRHTVLVGGRGCRAGEDVTTIRQNRHAGNKVFKMWNRVSPSGRTGEKLTGRGSTSLKKKGPAPTLVAAWHPWSPILLGGCASPPTPASSPEPSQPGQRTSAPAPRPIARVAFQDSFQALVSLANSRSSRRRHRCPLQ